eukprot:scaffold24848_cov174-Isochrysis_galbana.AAC.4
MGNKETAGEGDKDSQEEVWCVVCGVWVARCALDGPPRVSPQQASHCVWVVCGAWVARCGLDGSPRVSPQHASHPALPAARRGEASAHAKTDRKSKGGDSVSRQPSADCAALCLRDSL